MEIVLHCTAYDPCIPFEICNFSPCYDSYQAVYHLVATEKDVDMVRIH
jgi:hypothetical protein